MTVLPQVQRGRARCRKQKTKLLVETALTFENKPRNECQSSPGYDGTKALGVASWLHAATGAPLAAPAQSVMTN